MWENIKWNKKPLNNFPFKWKGKTYWYSRACAVALFLFCKDKNGVLHVLANQRGDGTPDYQGFWNCCCGYLDFNESGEEATCRECYEETGVKITPSILKIFGVETSPSANRQNVTIRYCGLIEDKTIEDFEFYLSHMEEDEVKDVRWIKLDNIGSYQWAFGHDKRILEAIENISK